MPDALPLFDDPTPKDSSPEAPASASLPARQRVPVWRASRGLARCKSCGEPMNWYHTVSRRKAIPFNADPAPVRTYRDGDGRVIDELDAADVHFRTCPYAAAHRRR